MAAQKEVIIYSTPTCHFCHDAKDFFTENHIAFKDYNVATDLEKRAEMITKSGQMGVPVINVGGELIIGFDEPRLREVLSL
ncbi:glutaredoxin family protein [Candidatus Kaiserbacteria bacterium]|nr:glutaredoxin family protein [Candidatus Kaiserbacteria bacterium]